MGAERPGTTVVLFYIVVTVGPLNPLAAALAMAASSLLVVGPSARPLSSK